MPLLPLKQTRMEFKTTEEVKSLLTQAATLAGVSLTTFVIDCVAEHARAIIAENTQLQLSANGQARFLAIRNNPAPATDALRELMALPALELAEQ